MLDQRGRTLFDALWAFYQEHEYCGELDTGIEGDRVWMTCTCGAMINQDVDRDWSTRASRRPAGARRAVRLDSPPTILHRGAMRLIGLVVIFVVSLALAPLAGEGQPAGGKVYRIGFLQAAPNTPALNYAETFRQGLRDHGYVEGQNIVIEHRVAKTPKDNPALLADLLGRKIDILVTWTTPALVAAKKATSAIPIVGISGDPIQTGLVASLARPGGNLTGLAILTDELELKNLQLLKEAFPGVTRVAVLWNPDNPVWPLALKRLQAAAPMLGVTIQLLAVRDLGELEAAFAAATKEKASALLVFREQIFGLHRQQIVNFANMHRLPAIYGGLPFVEVGGLIVYATNILDMIRRTGGYVDKLLKGAKPADLPIEQPTKFELVINLKTAKALGLTIPQSLLVRADQVIE